jgi:hypothetical protein
MIMTVIRMLLFAMTNTSALNAMIVISAKKARFALTTNVLNAALRKAIT